MSIEKMILATLTGDVQDFEECLVRCTRWGFFHPQPLPDPDTAAKPAGAATADHGADNPPPEERKPAQPTFNDSTSPTARLRQEDPFFEQQRKLLEDVASLAQLPLEYADFDDLDISRPQLPDYLARLNKRLTELTTKRQNYERIIAMHEHAIVHLSHLRSLNVNLDDLFSCQYVQVRFGRLPNESLAKLSYYDDRPFIFFQFDQDASYTWCLYLTDESNKRFIDSLFISLYFERLRIPDYAHGTPHKALDLIQADLVREQKGLADVQEQFELLRKQEAARLCKVFSYLCFTSQAMAVRRNAVATGGDFILQGFIPAAMEKDFVKLFGGTSTIPTFRPPESEPTISTPVRLKNNWLSRPFEMFVEMYGMPSYYEIDPTPFVALTYTLLFGIMFGDLGQGLVILLLGWYMGRKRGMVLGEIMMRIGVSSILFGILYGSVFGFEQLLNPLYSMLGFNFVHGKPIEIMAPESTNLILMGAVGMGVVIIIASMLLNIMLGFRQKNWERAIFSNNGLAGLVFYSSVVYAAVSSLLLGRNVLNPLYILGLIVLPLLVVYFKEILGGLAAGKKKLLHGSVGDFLLEGFFELFEVLLSFVTNTMSFLRVGGFVLSHAGMMAVVFTLSSMVSAGASPVVIVIGNLFVMAMEGLIVGIQVLRLEFYEIFSRFFEGNGQPYEPILVDYSHHS